jgi:hypothetical protein
MIKRFARGFLLPAVFVTALDSQLLTANAQGTAFTYQGRLNDGAAPATGIYDLRFTIYDTNVTRTIVGAPLTNSATGVTNGLFTVTLDFGPGIFTGGDRWIEIAVRTNGSSLFTALNPRQSITPAPYALLSYSVGTTGSSPLDLSAGSQRALRIQPNTAVAPDLIANAAVNQVAPGVVGATISGGGAMNYFGFGYSNRVTMDFGTIAGGLANTEEGFGGFIAGGYNNAIQSGAYYSSIAGGFGNTIGTNSTEAFIGGGALNFIPHDDAYAVIAGGYNQTNNSPYGVIGGGNLNFIADGSTYATIPGGAYNTAQPSTFSSTIGGGFGNTLQAGAFNAIIGGGFTNTIGSNAPGATISGGTFNTVGASALLATISGGTGHNNNSSYATIGGGLANTIQTNAPYSVIDGGSQNSLGSQYGKIGGGVLNVVSSNDDFAVINGGSGNVIAGPGSANVIGGGANNTVATNSVDNVIAGGNGNLMGSVILAGTISGGRSNLNGFNLNQPTISGGFANAIKSGGDYGVIAGGALNTNAGFISTILGGQNNLIDAFADHSIISGGGNNRITGSQLLSVYSAIGGGQFNTVQTNGSYSTIGAGLGNTIVANALYATIPGGLSNSAAGISSFAAGQHAQALHNGTFVWADANTANFSSSSSNQFLIRAAGGVGIGVTNPSVALEVAGTIKAASFSIGSSSTVVNFSADLLDGIDSSGFWKTTGNSGTIPGTHFLGTTDNQPVEIRANNEPVIRFSYGSSGSFGVTPNIAGGFRGNVIGAGVAGAVIAGGGAVGSTNLVLADGGTIGGGFGNLVSGSGGTIAGGGLNTASGPQATVGGGAQNQSLNSYTTVAGGIQNTSSGTFSAVGGGADNISGAFCATIPGGQSNSAAGNFSFAAGFRAKANHAGSFVWADSQNADLASSTNNQFNLRAAGGVRIFGIGSVPIVTIDTNGQLTAAGTTGNGLQGTTTSTIASGVYGENLTGNGYGVAGRASTAGVAVYGDNPNSSGWAGNFNGRLFAISAGINRSPALNAFEVEGNASKTTAGSWLANSDGRIKTDIATVTNALAKLAQVRLVQFRYSDAYRAAHPSIEDHPYLNVVAQEFAKVFPEDVKHSGEKLPGSEDDILQVDTYPLTIYSAAAVQELNRKLNEKDAEIQELKRTVGEMQKVLVELGRKAGP